MKMMKIEGQDDEEESKLESFSHLLTDQKKS
jgi:hypothetical protein